MRFSFIDASMGFGSLSQEQNHGWFVKLTFDMFHFSGRGLALPPGIPVPDVIQKALDSPSVRRSGNRDSLQRKQFWMLPYVVLEFDKNEILVEALGGDLSKPEWNYRADLCVPFVSTPLDAV